MLEILAPFRKALDDLMLHSMNHRVIIYGYDSYTGRFLKWYAEYYHNIHADYLISEDMTTGKGYDREVFRPSVLDFGYRDVRTADLWLAQPLTKELQEKLLGWGFEKDKNLFDFFEAVYGDDLYWQEEQTVDPFTKKKTGRRDIQFQEWLEWKYDCNFLTPISKDDFEVVDHHGARYSSSTQKELFPMLDHCHMHPGVDDAIFDFGCGKGAAILSFLDYGFQKVGETVRKLGHDQPL